MRIFFLVSVLLASVAAIAQNPAQPATGTQGAYTLTIQVQGVNQEGGNIGVLVFNNEKGWAEDRTAALRDIVVPAHPGTVTVVVPGLAAGYFAVSIAHDVNQNHKLDKNFLGKPKEQWGLSNNPHATLKAPPFKNCMFPLTGNMEIFIKMQ